jgi:hypothetical protein
VRDCAGPYPGLCAWSLRRHLADQGHAVARGAITTTQLVALVQPWLAQHVYSSMQAAFDAAVRLSAEVASRCGLEASGDAPVTHPAHLLHSLHRTLGFPGCPTDPVWPKDLRAAACAPVAGLAVAQAGGVQASGALVGCGLPDSQFPFTRVDDPAGVVAVLEVPVGSAELVG